MTEPLPKRANFVAITERPTGVGPAAAFGINLILAPGRNASWSLDWSREQPVLLVDLDADGSLAAEERVALEPSGEAFCGAIVMARDSMPLGVCATRRSPHALDVQNDLMRTGQIVLDEHSVGFALLGSAVSGFASRDSKILFDLDANGHFGGNDTLRAGADLASSPETYKPDEEFVQLGGDTYEFEVAANGDFLTLRRAAQRPPRPALTAGSEAPGFVFMDSEGQSHRLEDFRGKLVLLHFWTRHCPHSIAALPKLRALHERSEDELVLVGVAADGEDPSATRAIVEQEDVRWPQTIVTSERSVWSTYRVDQTPTFFLIDVDGTILARGSGLFIDRLEALVRDASAVRNGRGDL